MDWTEREIAVAKTLQEPDIQNLLKKVFTQIITSNGEILEKNVVALDDAEYGRIMKVHYLVKEEAKAKLNLIASISKKKVGEQKTGAIAPR
jgi:hypothetical protein